MTNGHPDGPRPVEVGVMVAATPSGAGLEDFTRQLVADIAEPLQQSSGREWRFQAGEVIELKSDENRRGADFVGEGSLRLAEGSFDLMIVVTDAPLMSMRERIVTGVASPLTRICVLSVRQLMKQRRGHDLALTSPQVRWNAATLALNLIGRVLDAPAAGKGAMAEFRYDPGRDRPEPFVPPNAFRPLADRFTEPEHRVSGAMSRLWAHLQSIAAEPGMVVHALVSNRAPFLALRLPGLAAAALAPVFLLVFTAEFWDAGLGMSNGTAIGYAIVSICAATLYLTFAQSLFLPRKDSNVVPRHLALANAVIFLTVLLGIIGLFVMLVLITFAIEQWVFPQGLISTWPTLHNPEVTLVDKARLAAFISTIGVTTGALAGGLQRNRVLRQLSLFETVA